ncbi:hypothetical protein GCM10023306_25880 [Novosphingobium ginsenosidimutans]
MFSKFAASAVKGAVVLVGILMISTGDHIGIATIDPAAIAIKRAADACFGEKVGKIYHNDFRVSALSSNSHLTKMLPPASQFERTAIDAGQGHRLCAA